MQGSSSGGTGGGSWTAGSPARESYISSGSGRGGGGTVIPGQPNYYATPSTSGGHGSSGLSMDAYDPAPTMTYEQVTASAQRSYEEYQSKQKAFDEKYGRLEHPEQYYGYRQRSQELGRLQEECVKLIDQMHSRYMEMDVEPLFTLSGPLEDPEPYQQQVSAMMSEMEDYIEASNGLPDPTALNQMQTNIVRLQAALLTGNGSQINTTNMQGALPRVGANPISLTQNELPQIQAEERSMLERTLNQIILGNYSDDVTLLGTAGQFLLGLTGVDVLMDARDLTYDLTHLKEVTGWQVLVDAVGLIPLIGALKNVDEVAALLKAFRQGENLSGGLADGALAGSTRYVDDLAEAGQTARRVDDLAEGTEAARAAQRLTETGAETAREADAVINMRPGVNKPEEFSLNPQSALDEDWYKKYNAAIEKQTEGKMKESCSGGHEPPAVEENNPDEIIPLGKGRFLIVSETPDGSPGAYGTTDPAVEIRLEECRKALEVRLAGRYESCAVAGRKAFRVPNGKVVALDYISAFGSMVVEHAENWAAAEMNWFEDGDLFHLEDMDEETMFQAMLREIEG